MRVLPVSDDLTAPYWEAAGKHSLVIQRCSQCGRLSHPPVAACPNCHGRTLTWDEMSGRGSVHAFTVVTHSVHPVSADATPYVIALIELEEGPRILTNLRECEADDVRVGLPVQVTFEDLVDTLALPQFRPRRPGAVAESTVAEAVA